MATIRGWGDGSEVKSTDYSSRAPEFNSQQPHGGSQPFAYGIPSPLLVSEARDSILININLNGYKNKYVLTIKETKISSV